MRVTDSHPRRLFLVGPMGVGKTTVANRLIEKGLVQFGGLPRFLAEGATSPPVGGFFGRVDRRIEHRPGHSLVNPLDLIGPLLGEVEAVAVQAADVPDFAGGAEVAEGGQVGIEEAGPDLLFLVSRYESLKSCIF